jgi:hypothetical protein
VPRSTGFSIEDTITKRRELTLEVKMRAAEGPECRFDMFFIALARSFAIFLLFEETKIVFVSSRRQKMSRFAN